MKAAVKNAVKNVVKKVNKKEIAQYIFSIMLTGCAVFGWWGALYPRFTLLAGTYEVVCEENAQEDSQMPEEDKDMLYWQILGADPSQIRMKSKLWENWKTLRGVGSERYESGD